MVGWRLKRSFDAARDLPGACAQRQPRIWKNGRMRRKPAPNRGAVRLL